MNKLWDATYWSERLIETERQAKPILEKFYPVKPEDLTVEDLFKIRNLLEEYGSYSRLLHESMTKPDPKPIPLWKKLLNKF